jgi:CRP/FNR family transcriptional regulator, anaerobic regulatory protein
MQTLNELFNNHPSIVAYLNKNAVAENYSAKHILKEVTNSNKFIYLIKTGIVRTFYTEEGSYKTFNFHTENDIIIELESLYQKQSIPMGIEVLTDTELIKISNIHYTELLQKFPELYPVLLQLAHSYIIQANKRFFMLKKMKAAQKWQYFIENYQTIAYQIPLGTIASFLNIQQETLSRIRGK